MQAVILAAGESSRFWPLNYQHKSLFYLMGRPLIWYTIDGLRRAGIKEIIIIEDPKKDVERELKTCPVPKRSFWCGVKFLIQEKPLGTGNALWQTRNYLYDNFFVLNGDVLNSKEILGLMMKKFPI